MIRAAWLLAGVLLTWGCASRTGPGPDTGVEGRILKGPMCPGPVLLGRPCPNRPAEGPFVLVDASGREAARFRTDAQGRFRVAAPPGRYAVMPILMEGEPFLAGRHEVVVPGTGWIRVELTFDSGMR